jgi:hypothetical protein
MLNLSKYGRLPLANGINGLGAPGFRHSLFFVRASQKRSSNNGSIPGAASRYNPTENANCSAFIAI